MTEQLTLEQVFSPLIRNEYWVTKFLEAYKELLRTSSKKELNQLIQMIITDWYYFNQTNILLNEEQSKNLQEKLEKYHKHGKLMSAEHFYLPNCVYWNGVCGACDIGNISDCPCEDYEGDDNG